MSKATRRARGWAAAAFVSVAALLPAGPVQALVTLDTQIVDIRCGVTSDAGTAFSECSSPSFSAALAPGQTAFLSLTVDFHYTDDGLPLERPFAFQLDPNGLNMLPVPYEAAVLYPQSNNCSGSRYCRPPPHLVLGGTGFAPLVLGLNDEPDDIRASWDLSVTIGAAAGQPLGATADLFLGFTPVTVSAPIPEPATVALLGSGLAALAWRRRRRTG
jgi:hypothetical protein